MANTASEDAEEVVYIDGERIEIAGTYPDVESTIKALHEGG